MEKIKRRKYPRTNKSHQFGAEHPSTSKMVDFEEKKEKELKHAEENGDFKPPEASEVSVKNMPRRKRRLHTYERALLMYEKIQAERREQAEKRRLERERRKEAMENYMGIKKKMDRALKKRNRRGQPNLNAQVEVLLEKIQKRMKK